MPKQAPVKFAPVEGLSRTRIDRSGEALRLFFDGTDVSGDPRYPSIIDAYGNLIKFRATFQQPLDKTVMGLRSMVCSEWPELLGEGQTVPVTQRLKRSEQIMSKLSRMRGSALSNMGDIGGCRAVLDDRDRVNGVLRRIKKNWSVHGEVRDSRDEPAPSGYRAVHVIVLRAGRRIEVQLRDPREHEWAVAVERTGQRLGMPLKEGLGPDDLKEYFRMASEGMYLDSMGTPPGPEFDEAFAAIREQVRERYFSR